MVAVQVMGNDAAIGFAGSQGNFELNVFKPVIIHNFLHSVRLLSDTCRSFADHCAVGIEADEEVIAGYVRDSLMLVTALAPKIGYDMAAKVAKQGHKEKKNLKQVCLELKLMTEEEFDEALQPLKMCFPGV